LKLETIACIDVYYTDRKARAACVLFLNDPINTTIAEYSVVIDHVEEYISGQFYKRELPCILKVLEAVEQKIDLIIVDSFVFLGEGKKGLGAYLYEALDMKVAVAGVAKTYFHEASDCREVLRGTSAKPLYVSAIGCNVQDIAKLVEALYGEFRIPDVLKRVDTLSRIPLP
jgi:deoxyribonuclease V